METQDEMRFSKNTGTQETARATDPDTSQAAGKAQVAKRSELQKQVIAAFIAHGKMSDDQLTSALGFLRKAPGTVRKRRSELSKLGVVVAVGTTINEYGSQVIVWDLHPGYRHE